MAKKVKLTTTITQIIKDGPILPKSPLFVIQNDSYYPLSIDNYELGIGKTFSIDAEAIVAEMLETGVPIENTTTFNIRFYDPGIVTTQRISAQLIETFIKFVDE